jgi:hypothetical protein
MFEKDQRMKMKKLRTHLLGGLFLLALATPSLAASLGLIPGQPELVVGSATVDYFEIGPDGDLSSFGTLVDGADGVSPTGVTELGFGFGFDLANPIVGATGGFDVTDENGLFLSGELQAVGFRDDVIELEFGALSGSAASSFDASVLMQIAFIDDWGVNPFTKLVDGNSYSTMISIANAAPVPVPAALPLFLSALGFAAVFTRRRRKV